MLYYRVRRRSAQAAAIVRILNHADSLNLTARDIAGTIYANRRQYLCVYQ
ncbi:MAG: hypothetical protein R2875_18180 [Desulfobacterales bacterium]